MFAANATVSGATSAATPGGGVTAVDAAKKLVAGVSAAQKATMPACIAAGPAVDNPVIAPFIVFSGVPNAAVVIGTAPAAAPSKYSLNACAHAVHASASDVNNPMSKNFAVNVAFDNAMG